MTKFFNRSNPIWNQHNIVITISILALLVTLPLSVLMVATTDRPADVRSRAQTDSSNSCYGGQTQCVANSVWQELIDGKWVTIERCAQNPDPNKKVCVEGAGCSAPGATLCQSYPPTGHVCYGSQIYSCATGQVARICENTPDEKGNYNGVNLCVNDNQCQYTPPVCTTGQTFPTNPGITCNEFGFWELTNRNVCTNRPTATPTSTPPTATTGCWLRPDVTQPNMEVTQNTKLEMFEEPNCSGDMVGYGNASHTGLHLCSTDGIGNCYELTGPWSECTGENYFRSKRKDDDQCTNYVPEIGCAISENITQLQWSANCSVVPTATPTPPTPPALSCEAGEQVATIAENHFNSAEDITPVAYNNAGYAYKYDLLDSSDITKSLNNWELTYKIIPRSVNSGQLGFNTSLHTCLNGCEKSEVGEGVTHWSSVINDTSHFYPDDPDSHRRNDYLAMIFNSLFYTKSEAETYCPSKDGSFTLCTNDERGYYSDIFEFNLNQEYRVKLTKMGDSLGVEIADQEGNQVFTDNIPASKIPMNWVDIASWGNLSTGVGLIYDVSVNQDKRLDWYVKRPDTSTDMRFELDDLVVRGCTGVASSCQQLLDLATNRWKASCGDENYDPRADVNKDGTINTLDIAIITANIDNETWCAEKLKDDTNPCPATPTPTPPTGPMCRADFNGNGDIDIEDLQVFINDAQADCSIRDAKQCVFTDIPAPSGETDDWQRELYTAVTSICQARVTDGCGDGKYCPNDPTTRAQAAVLVLKAFHGGYYKPPAATGEIFKDVPKDHWAAAWIEQFYREGFTDGCDNENYCPDDSMTRAQAAVFLLKARYGPKYTPPEATGNIFRDVPKDYWAAAWIEQLYRTGLTKGCDSENYCPDDPTTRAQMAVLLSRTFENLTPPVSTCRADIANHNGDIDIEDLQVLIEEAQKDCSIGTPTPPSPTHTPIPPTVISTPTLSPTPDPCSNYSDITSCNNAGCSWYACVDKCLSGGDIYEICGWPTPTPTLP